MSKYEKILRLQQTFASVDDVIAMLQRESSEGKGGYLVRCNDEYYLARKLDKPMVSDKKQTVDLGGYE